MKIQLSIGFFIALLLSSCEAYLDKSPEMGVTDIEVYSNYLSFRGALDKVYVFDHDFFLPVSNGYIFALGDEGITTASGNPALDVNNGNYLNSTSLEMGFYQHSGMPGGVTSIEIRYMPLPYFTLRNLRNINLCIEHIDDITDATDRQKEELLGQAYFYRAWNYFQLIRRFGGMFLFDKSFDSNSVMDLPRLSYQESTEWLIKDLDMAINLLPDVWSEAEKGRVTKTAALALKGMALLYAASPNMNENLQYNEDYCKRTIDATWATIQHIQNTGLFKLMPGLNVDDYSKIFYSKTQLVSEEAIFYKMTLANSSEPGIPAVGSWNACFNPNTRESGNVHMASPTQNLIDLFETINGLPIEDDPSYNSQAPYTRRDPRFYYGILYNGLEWNKGAPASHKKLEFWEKDDFENRRSNDLQANSYPPRSPYGVRKWLPETCNKWDNDYKYYMQSIHIRVAQLYLDFAEAANVLYGPTMTVPGTSMSALDAINIIRARVGQKPVDSRYTVSKEEFQKRIYNERAVELCFENHRWHDIRRWRIAEDVLKEIRKAYITRTGEDTYSYQYVRIADNLQRVFEEKHYWYPFPQTEINKLNVFKQNPGW